MVVAPLVLAASVFELVFLSQCFTGALDQDIWPTLGGNNPSDNSPISWGPSRQQDNDDDGDESFEINQYDYATIEPPLEAPVTAARLESAWGGPPASDERRLPLWLPRNTHEPIHISIEPPGGFTVEAPIQAPVTVRSLEAWGGQNSRTTRFSWANVAANGNRATNRWFYTTTSRPRQTTTEADRCILIRAYPFSDINNFAYYYKNLTVSKRRKRSASLEAGDFGNVEELLSRSKRSNRIDFIDRHYIAVEASASGDSGGRGTDWTSVMKSRELDLPHRRQVGKHTFVNFSQRSPQWSYSNSSCTQPREIVETEQRLQTWQLRFDRRTERWVESFCVWTPIRVSLDWSGAPVHMGGPVYDRKRQIPC